MRQQTIKARLVRIFAGVILSVSLFSVVSIEIIYRVCLSTLYQRAVETSYLLGDRIGGELNRLERESRDLLAAEQTQRFLRTVNELDTDSRSYYQQTTQWHADLSKTFSFRESYYQSVGSADLSGRIVSYGHAVEGRTARRLLEILNNEARTDGTMSWHVLRDGAQVYLVAVRTVRNLQLFELSPIGSLFYILDFEKILQKSIAGYLSYGGMDFAVYLSGQPLYGGGGHADSAPTALSDSAGYRIVDWQGGRLLLTEIRVDDYGLLLRAAQDVGHMAESLRLCRTALLALIVIEAFIIFVVSFYKTLSVTGRITRLTSRVRQVYGSRFKIDVTAQDDGPRDEVTVLAGSFQTLVRQVDGLVNEVLERKLLYKEAQIRVLQSQINPHFLYNTLDTISAIATLRQVPQISGMTEAMAAIMRYSLDQNILSHVGDELEMLKRYILIQRMRFGERLQLRIAVGQDCEDIELPKMTFQPLIENAIKYSVEIKQATARVKLRVSQLHGGLVVSVLDTGIGMPPQVERLVRERRFEALPGHGLRNVLQRLDNLFGERLNLTMRTLSGSYTGIRIFIADQGAFTNVEKNDCTRRG